MMEKNEQRKTIRNSTINSNPDNNSLNDVILSNSTTINNTIDNDYTFIDDSTLLHFYFGEGNEYQIKLNYTYNIEKNNLPFMVMIKNEYLGYLKNMSQDYLYRHGIMYDLIIMPSL
jgi:hypothetical protein